MAADSAPQAPIQLDPEKLRAEVTQLEAQADIASRVSTSLARFAPAQVKHLQLAIKRHAMGGQLRQLIDKAKASTLGSEHMQGASDEQKELAWVALVCADIASMAGAAARDNAQKLNDQTQQLLGRAAAKRELLQQVAPDEHDEDT